MEPALAECLAVARACEPLPPRPTSWPFKPGVVGSIPTRLTSPAAASPWNPIVTGAVASCFRARPRVADASHDVRAYGSRAPGNPARGRAAPRGHGPRLGADRPGETLLGVDAREWPQLGSLGVE